MYSVCVSAVDISCNPFLPPSGLERFLRERGFYSGTSIDSDHLRFHPDEIIVVAATSVAGALVLELVFRAQTAVRDESTERLGFIESGSVDALVAGQTNFAHSPNIVALEHPFPTLGRLRSWRGRVRAVLHTWNSRRWFSIGTAAHFVHCLAVSLPLVVFRAFVWIVTTAHDPAPLVLAVVDLVMTVVRTEDVIKNLFHVSITFFPRLTLFLEAHARVVSIVLAPWDACVRRLIRFVVAFAPVRAIPVHAVHLVAFRGR